LVCLHDIPPAHRSILVTGFLAKNKLTTLEHPPPPRYSTDQSPDVFYLLPRTKLELKGRRFCDATHIIKNATKELKRLSQNGFQECFQHLWQKCIFAQRDYFEGNVSEMIVLFRISYKLRDSGNILKLPCV
jgi:hypothetical protein